MSSVTSGNSKYDVAEAEVVDCVKKDSQKYFIKVPLSIIEDKTMDKERVALFCYLAAHVGINSKVLISLPMLYEYFNLKWDKHIYDSDRWNKNHIKKLLDRFRDIGFVEYIDGDQLLCSGKKITEIYFFKNYVFDCNNDYFENKQFAKIYLDELYEIMAKRKYDYEEVVKKNKGRDKCINSSALRCIDVLLGFAWLRAKIPMNHEDAGFSKQAEAYSFYYKDMVEATGLSEGVVSDIVGMLKNDLNLVYCESGDVKISKGNDGKKFFNWDRCIITNAYKRVGSETVDCGQRYAEKQIEMKKQEIADYLANGNGK